MISLLKENLQETYDGGRYIGENFWYSNLIGGPYLKGKEFDTTEPQVEQQLQFAIKFLQVGITMSKEDVQVINKGPNAIFRLIESRMQNAYKTLGAMLEIALYLNGQNVNYTANFNGLAEAINDGAANSFDGNTYATYGTITRGGAVGTTLNSVPQNIAGTIEYNSLEENYGACSYGNGEWEPSHIVTTYLGYSYIKEKFQTQQRFQNTQDPKIGFNGLQFNNATVLRSRYCPGTAISAALDPVAVTFMKQMTNNAVVVYPTMASETLWFLNARKPFINFYVSDDPEFQMGFTGWKPGQGNTKIIGQVLFAGAPTFAPRYHRQLYGITG